MMHEFSQIVINSYSEDDGSPCFVYEISVLISQELTSDGLLVLPILFSAVDEDLVGNIHRQFCSVTKR